MWIGIRYGIARVKHASANNDPAKQQEVAAVGRSKNIFKVKLHMVRDVAVQVIAETCHLKLA